MLHEMPAPEERARLVTGALMTWIGWGMCWWGILQSYATWQKSPQNWNEGVKNFLRSKRQVTSKSVTDPNFHWVNVFKYHPGTISEMIGDTSSPQGGIAMAASMPGLILALIGNVMIHLGGESYPAYLFRMVRAVSASIGLLMVLWTPVASLAPSKEKRAKSELEMKWLSSTDNLHEHGFSLAVVLGVPMELSCGMYDIFWALTTGRDLTNWAATARLAYLSIMSMKVMVYTVSILSLIKFVPLLMLRSRGLMDPGSKLTEEQRKLATSPTFFFKCWLGEFNVLICGACGMMLHACSIFVGPEQGPYTYIEIVFVSLFLILTCYLVLAVQGFMAHGFLAFERIDWGSMVRAMHIKTLGPVMRGLQHLCKEDLVTIHVVQAGKPDAEDEVASSVYGGLGSTYPKICELVLRPTVYSNAEAFEMHEISSECLQEFNQDLAHVLRALQSVDTLYIPHGPQLKHFRRFPKMRLSCSNYASDVANILKAAKESGYRGKQDMNTEAAPPAEEDEVAFDITSWVLKDERASFLNTESLPTRLERSDCKSLYELFGCIMKTSFPDPGGLLPDADEILAVPSYEVQIRGLLKPKPTIILRTLTRHADKLPEDILKSPKVDASPPSAQGKKSQ